MVLYVRRESPLFPSVLGRAVVFDVYSNAPVFSVWYGKSNDRGFRAGLYQLSEMPAKGHPNPFGAITCYDKT